MGITAASTVTHVASGLSRACAVCWAVIQKIFCTGMLLDSFLLSGLSIALFRCRHRVADDQGLSGRPARRPASQPIPDRMPRYLRVWKVLWIISFKLQLVLFCCSTQADYFLRISQHKISSPAWQSIFNRPLCEISRQKFAVNIR